MKLSKAILRALEVEPGAAAPRLACVIGMREHLGRSSMTASTEAVRTRLRRLEAAGLIRKERQDSGSRLQRDCWFLTS